MQSRCYDYINQVGWRLCYQQLSLQEMDCHSCCTQSKKSIVFLAFSNSKISTPPRLYESYDKWHQRLGNELQLLLKSAVLPELTHPLTQPPTTDSCESLQRVMGCKWVKSHITLPVSDYQAGFLLTSLGLDRCSVEPCVWAVLDLAHSKKLSTVCFPTSHCSLVSILARRTKLLRPRSRVVSRYCAHSRLLRLVGGYRAFVAVLFYWLELPVPSLCYTAAHRCVSSHELRWWMGQAHGIHNNILSTSASLQEKAWYQSPNIEDETRVEDYTQPP